MHGEIGIDIESPVPQRSKFIVQCQPMPIGMDRISIRYVCECMSFSWATTKKRLWYMTEHFLPFHGSGYTGRENGVRRNPKRKPVWLLPNDYVVNKCAGRDRPPGWCVMPAPVYLSNAIIVETIFVNGLA